VGTIADRYQLDALIGQGGYGAVYRARHTVTSAIVAVKVIKPGEADAGPRFLREAKASATIANKHVVPVTDAGVTRDGLFFLVMELLDGESLSQVLRRMGKLPIRRAVEVSLQVLDAIGAAHARGIVHRDLKPANVFLTRDEAGAELVRVLDFGVMKVQDAASGFKTQEGVLLGTPAYVAPELFAGAKADPRSDLYAVSLMLYEMLSGVRPFVHADVASLARRIMDEPPPPLSSRVPDIDPGLVALIERGLAKEPAARWQTAEALAKALRPFARAPVALDIGTNQFVTTPRKVPSVPPGYASVPPGHASVPPGRPSHPEKKRSIPPTAIREPDPPARPKLAWLAAGALTALVAVLACVAIGLGATWVGRTGASGMVGAPGVVDELVIEECRTSHDMPAIFGTTGESLSIMWLREERHYLSINIVPSLFAAAPRAATGRYDLGEDPIYVMMTAAGRSYGTMPLGRGQEPASGVLELHEWNLEHGEFHVEFENVVLPSAFNGAGQCRLNGSLRSR
jgi:serine/threonine-protein kinase